MSINKKTVKIVVITFLIACLLFVGAVVFFVMTVDQSAIKNKAAEYVYSKTGRELKIAGDISWQFFPWLGVKMEDVSLGNAPGFKDTVFVKAKSVNVAVKLLPLITGRIEAGKLIIKDLELNLSKNKEGIGNWQDMFISHKTSSHGQMAEAKHYQLKEFAISRIEIDNGKVFWQDQKANKALEISSINLACKNINFKKPFIITGSFYLKDLKSGLIGNINTRAHVKIDIGNGLYEFKSWQITGKLMVSNKATAVDFKNNLDIFLDLKNQLLIVKNIKQQIEGIIITGSLQGSNILREAKYKGDIAINDSDPKRTIELLGISKWPKNLTKTSVKANFTGSPAAIKLSGIDGKLGDMMLQGNASYSKNQITFNFNLSKFNFDDLIDVAAKPKGGKKNKLVAKPVSTKTKKAIISNSQNSFLLNKKVVGQIKIGTVQFKNLKLNNFSAVTNGDGGVLDWQKIDFNFYDGKVFGSGSYDVRDVKNKLRLKLSGKGISVKNLLQNLAQYKQLKGALSMDVDVSMVGDTGVKMFKSLDGSGKLLVSNGSYVGVDIPYEVRRANSLLNNKPMPKKTQPPHTDFDSLTMSFKINNAVLNTDDILVQAPDYKVTGEGKANLVAEQLELLLSAYSNNDKNFFVPIRITGSFASPLIKPDVAVMIGHTVKKVIKDKIGKHLENLPQDIRDILPF